MDCIFCYEDIVEFIDFFEDWLDCVISLLCVNVLFVVDVLLDSIVEVGLCDVLCFDFVFYD